MSTFMEINITQIISIKVQEIIIIKKVSTKMFIIYI